MNQSNLVNKILQPNLPAFLYKLLVLIWLVLVVILAGVLIYVETAGGNVPDLVIFLGRFHPLVLHFPIGIVMALVLLKIYHWIMKVEKSYHSEAVLWFLAAITGAKAAILGLLLSARGEYDPELLFWHKVMGCVLGFVLLIGAFFQLRYLKNADGGSSKLATLCLFLAAVILPIVGHDGGSLTHGSKYLTEYQPEFLNPILGKIDRSASMKLADSSLAGKVVGIFEDQCIKCHGPEKQKGKYRLDTRENALLAGESDLPALVPGQPENSNLLYLISLPKHTEEMMPPEGKGDLSAQDILDISHWIYEGAEWPVENAIVIESIHVANKNPEEEKIKSRIVKDFQAIDESTESKNSEPPIAKKSETLVSNSDRIDFEKQVWPILEDYCLKCHQAPYKDENGRTKKPKADLRVDTAELLMQGSENDVVIIPENPEDSSLYYLTTLDIDDDDVMPPKGDLLTKKQQKIIYDWILQGAKFGAWKAHKK